MILYIYRSYNVIHLFVSIVFWPCDQTPLSFVQTHRSFVQAQGPGWRGLGLATFRGGLDEEAGHRQARRVSPRRGAGGRRSTPRVRMRTKHRPNLRGVTGVSIWERSGDQGSWSAMFFGGGFRWCNCWERCYLSALGRLESPSLPGMAR